METNKKDKTKLFKNFAWVSGFLCVLCCALPPLSIAIGVGSLTVIAMFMEKIAVIFLLLAVTFFTIWYLKRKKAASCDINCACKHINKKV